FDVESFIGMLIRNSEKQVSESILFHIRDFTNSIKEVTLQKMFVISGKKEVLDEIEGLALWKRRIGRRISENELEILAEIAIDLPEIENGIFIKKEIG
ncbi:MAG: hypothetical protein ACOCWM_05940, partial [Cyclobacteriaceae bacterium]